MYASMDGWMNKYTWIHENVITLETFFGVVKFFPVKIQDFLINSKKRKFVMTIPNQKLPERRFVYMSCVFLPLPLSFRSVSWSQSRPESSIMCSNVSDILWLAKYKSFLKRLSSSKTYVRWRTDEYYWFCKVQYLLMMMMIIIIDDNVWFITNSRAMTRK
jgi:hypothetical protein